MTEEKKSMVPKLRFPEFTATWEQRKLKDFTLSYSGGTPTVSNKNYYNGTIPFIRSGEISGERTELFISEEGLNKSSAKRVHKGQILYALYGATSGEVSLSKIDGAINQAVLAISTKEGYSNAFLSFWLRKEKDRITATFLQGGQGNLSGEIVKDLIVPVPSQLEQTKIGDFFNQLDGLITLHQRKLEGLSKLKKSLLQKMFPKNGSLGPELRFPGFTGDWEQRKLEDCATIIMGQSPKSENYTNDPKDHILVQGNADLKNGQVVPRVWTTEVTKVGKVGDIILSVRAPVGEVGKTAFDVVIGRGVAAIRGNDFLLQTLQKLKEFKYWGRVSAGSTFDSITSEILKSTVISMPAIEEQIKIGEFLSSVDNLIILHQRKLESLKKLKKSLLQQMFV